MAHPTFPVRRFSKCSLISATILTLLFLAFSSARADWPDNNANVAKWIEMPDRSANGFDVLAGQAPGSPTQSTLAIILADDFQCTMTGPITDVHIWTSWISLNGSTNIPGIPITLGFWTDIPASNNPTTGQMVPSHPGALLWSQTLTPGLGLGHYTARPWTGAQEQFWDPDPAPSGNILGPDNLIWQYNFYPSNAFVQQGGPNAPVIYWLSMTTGNNTTSATGGALMGWKTSTNQLLDNAVFGHLDSAGNPLSDWQELIAPTSANKRSLDLSFVLTTPEVITNPPPPPNKWLQPPNLLNGYDVDATAPFVAADDFLCTNASTITNIQVWGSWKGDVVGTNTTFIVSIWSDVPSTVPGGFSHPGALEWSETFAPGTYSAGFYTNGQEQFLIPPSTLSPETAVYLYSFNPQNPFCQQGSTQSPMVYWLSVYAINTSAVGATSTFGWKTTPSSNHWRDDAVYGSVDSFGNMGGWHELFAPLGAAPISLDLAFLLNNGPPNPDCDRTVGTKWLQPPDRSTNGLDVFDTSPEILGDDFICHAPGQITGVTIWGSWLGDIADSNATFQLGLWTDVPATTINGVSSPSHPGQELCSTTFYPPQAVGTSLQRYQYFPAIPNVHETFYKPDIAGTGGFIGTDSIIWRYDFYPFQTEGDCWLQRGSPLGPGLTYWITLSYVPTNGSPDLFGWKTSTTHNIDDAVYGHLSSSSGSPLGDWKDLHDPRTGVSLDLSFAMRNFPVTGINKDIRNTTTVPETGIQIVVSGFHIITWHYDGSPVWPSFKVTYVAGNTLLTWTGQTIPVGGLTHVGFEMGSSALPNIVSINWLLGGAVVQPPIPQGNFHWLNSGTILTFVNDITPNAIFVSNIITEFHAGPVALDQMINGGNRNPISTVTPQKPTGAIMPGLASIIAYPPNPANALYSMLQVNLMDANGNPTTTDFILMPLDGALIPAVQDAALQGNLLVTHWSSVPGRTYNIQYSPSITSPSWTDSGLGDIVADSAESMSTIPVNGGGRMGFYRVVMLPQ